MNFEFIERRENMKLIIIVFIIFFLIFISLPKFTLYNINNIILVAIIYLIIFYTLIKHWKGTNMSESLELGIVLVLTVMVSLFVKLYYDKFIRKKPIESFNSSEIFISDKEINHIILCIVAIKQGIPDEFFTRK